MDLRLCLKLVALLKIFFNFLMGYSFHEVSPLGKESKVMIISEETVLADRIRGLRRE